MCTVRQTILNKFFELRSIEYRRLNFSAGPIIPLNFQIDFYSLKFYNQVPTMYKFFQSSLYYYKKVEYLWNISFPSPSSPSALPPLTYHSMTGQNLESETRNLGLVGHIYFILNINMLNFRLPGSRFHFILNVNLLNFMVPDSEFNMLCSIWRWTWNPKHGTLKFNMK